MAAPDGSRTQPRTVPEVPLLDWAWIKPAKASASRGRANLERRERESFIICSIELRAGSGLFQSHRRARSWRERAKFLHERIDQDRKSTRLNSSHLGISY